MQISYSLCRITIILVALSCLMGCQTSPPVNNQHQQDVRNKLVEETALTYASRYALHWESKFINKHIHLSARTLDQVFNFRELLLENNLVPPILTEATHNISLDSPDVIRASDKIIRIVKPAQFTSAIPSWQQYLMMHYPLPEKPVSSLLPRNAQERAIWDASISKGWQAGIVQATQIFRTNMSALKRDYMGMILYYKLLAQGMISPSHSATANLGITGNDKEMQLNDRIVKITTTSKLLPSQVQQWKPALR